jgi:hypothetical protein
MVMQSSPPPPTLGRKVLSASGNLGYNHNVIPDVPYRFTIRPLPEDESGGYLVESRRHARLDPGDARRGRPIPAPIPSAAAWALANSTEVRELDLPRGAPGTKRLLHSGRPTQLTT